MTRPYFKPNAWHALGLGLLGTLLAVALWGDQRVAQGLLPHGWCFTWNPQLLAVHVTSDFLIGLAYVSIPLTLINLVRRRGDLPFNWIFLLFALFIISCGLTHWMEIWTVWSPSYWLAGSVKAVTATASVLTAVAFERLTPKLLAIPTVAQLRAAKEALELEVRQRRAAEAALQAERESLAQRVEERTRELVAARAAAEAAQAEAQEANRLKDQFLARVSHELRTPLQATVGWVQVLGHAGLPRERLDDAVERIRHNVALQARMLDDLLDVARILSGKLRFELHAIDPSEPIRRAVEVVQGRAAQRRVRIDVAPALPPAARVLGDAARLEQVVWNLLNNAIQASPEGGRVQLTAEVRDGTRLRLAVRDWGRGIAAADLTRIFEPFQQLQPGAGGGHGGLGLGLAIARSIVALFGGELRASSDGEGQGACFEVELPLHAAPPQPEEPEDDRPLEPAERATLQGLRVLYVEDAPDVADAVTLLLQQEGLQVQACRHHDEAAAAVDAGAFDVLLCDLDLGPGPGGLDLARRLRARGARQPAIALSAYSTEDDRRVSADAGFDLHLAKPASVQRIGRAIARLWTPQAPAARA